MLLLSNDPPLVLDERMQPLGVMVAALHYHQSKARPIERQGMFDREEEIARRQGYEWSGDYLNGVIKENLSPVKASEQSCRN